MGGKNSHALSVQFTSPVSGVAERGVCRYLRYARPKRTSSLRHRLVACLTNRRKGCGLSQDHRTASRGCPARFVHLSVRRVQYPDDYSNPGAECHCFPERENESEPV